MKRESREEVDKKYWVFTSLINFGSCPNACLSPLHLRKRAVRMFDCGGLYRQRITADSLVQFLDSHATPELTLGDMQAQAS